MPHKIWPPNGHLAQWVLDQFPAGYRGHAVDVGASDGVSVNTTFHLEKVHRWTVISVEPNPEFHPMLKRERAWVESCALSRQSSESAVFHVHNENPEAYSALRVTERTDMHPQGDATWRDLVVTVRTVDELLHKWQFPKLDLLAVDTEGTEVDVLGGCDLRAWKPKTIIVESWDAGGHDAYLAQTGYARVGRNVHNDLYLRSVTNV